MILNNARLIDGTGRVWDHASVRVEGERIASFTHRRLREKTRTGGTSTLRMSAVNPDLECAAHTLLDALGWHGLHGREP